MKQRLYILRTLILIPVLCMTARAVYAQDSEQIISPDKKVVHHEKDTGMMTTQIPADVNNLKRRDSTKKEPVLLPAFTDTTFGGYAAFTQYLLNHNAIFRNTEHPLPDMAHPLIQDESASNGTLFYVILGALFLLAIIRLGFQKYFSDLFRAFFSPTLSQRQLREQLFQTPFPALLLNLFFTISAGLYLYFVLLHTHYMSAGKPVFLIGVFILLFMVIYLVKYVFLRFGGWLFGQPEVMDSYIFTLYLINKVMGVILLPFILILAFSSALLSEIALDISLFMIILLFVYRYIRVYSMARNYISFSKFHFFIYLCSFEIAPVLILGKLVLIWLNGA